MIVARRVPLSDLPSGTLLAKSNSMIRPLSYQLLVFWLSLALVIGFIKSVPAAILSPNEKIHLSYQGRSYEILKVPGLNSIRVLTPQQMGPYRDELILKVKRGNHSISHVHLRLSSTTPEQMIYTGILPSRVQWQGNLTFELTQTKYRR